MWGQGSHAPSQDGWDCQSNFFDQGAPITNRLCMQMAVFHPEGQGKPAVITAAITSRASTGRWYIEGCICITNMCPVLSIHLFVWERKMFFLHSSHLSCGRKGLIEKTLGYRCKCRFNKHYLFLPAQWITLVLYAHSCYHYPYGKVCHLRTLLYKSAWLLFKVRVNYTVVFSELAISNASVFSIRKCVHTFH